MSKTQEEQASEIVAALLKSEKGAAYLAGEPAAMAENIATVWTKIFQTIRTARSG